MKLRAIVALSSAALLTMVFALVSGAGPPPCPADVDSDGACDVGVDNCLGVANPGQGDPDEDGYGTACDTDIDNNCTTGANDAFAVFGAIGAGSPWTPASSEAMDIDENGTVGANDAFAVFGVIGAAPGPSARSCASCPSTVPGTCPNL